MESLIGWCFRIINRKCTFPFISYEHIESFNCDIHNSTAVITSSDTLEEGAGRITDFAGDSHYQKR
jgi:hypothetical protein